MRLGLAAPGLASAALLGVLPPNFPVPRVGVVAWLESGPPGEAVRLRPEGVDDLGGVRVLFREGVPPRGVCARVGVPTLGGVPIPSLEPLVGVCLTRECLIGSARGGVVTL